jgi:L-fucose isomerase-like protein
MVRRSVVMEPLKAGYVSFGTQFYKPERLKEISARAEKQLAEAGIELIRTGPVTGEGAEPERAIRELKAGEWDFLIANVVNWIEVRGVTRVLLEFRDKPLLLYSLGGFTEGDTMISPAAGAGTTALRYPLERWGFKFRYLFNGPDEKMDLAGVARFGRAAQVMKKLRYARLGMIGWNDMGLYTTAFDTVKMRDIIGPEVESVDLLQLDRKMAALDPAEVKREILRVTKDWEYPLGKPKDEVVERAFRIYLATVRICEEKRFSAFSYKCVDGIDLEMNATHAVPSALVADAGFPYIDENDVLNLAAELMLKWLTGKQVMFLEHYEHHPEWILLGEDGYIPREMIDGKPRIKPVQTALLGGIVQCSRLKLGRMTCAALAEDDDGYRMHIVSGEGRTPPQWVEMGVPLPSWPSVKFYPDGKVRSILDHVLSQHFAVVFGDHAKDLAELCGLLGIKAIVD